MTAAADKGEATDTEVPKAKVEATDYVQTTPDTEDKSDNPNAVLLGMLRAKSQEGKRLVELMHPPAEAEGGEGNGNEEDS